MLPTRYYYYFVGKVYRKQQQKNKQIACLECVSCKPFFPLSLLKKVGHVVGTVSLMLHPVPKIADVAFCKNPKCVDADSCMCSVYLGIKENDLTISLKKFIFRVGR